MIQRFGAPTGAGQFLVEGIRGVARRAASARRPGGARARSRRPPRLAHPAARRPRAGSRARGARRSARAAETRTASTSRLDDLAGRQPSEQTTLEEILLRALPRVGHRRRGAERLLEREQSFEHADRRVERRAHRAALRLAVPAAVRELFAQQSIDESIAALAEIGAERDDAAVDARLDLTLEEGRVSELRVPR